MRAQRTRIAILRAPARRHYGSHWPDLTHSLPACLGVLNAAGPFNLIQLDLDAELARRNNFLQKRERTASMRHAGVGKAAFLMQGERYGDVNGGDSDSLLSEHSRAVSAGGHNIEDPIAPPPQRSVYNESPCLRSVGRAEEVCPRAS